MIRETRTYKERDESVYGHIETCFDRLRMEKNVHIVHRRVLARKTRKSLRSDLFGTIIPQLLPFFSVDVDQMVVDYVF